MSLGVSGNATIRRPLGGSLRCGVYRVEIVAVDTYYRASAINGVGGVQVDGADVSCLARRDGRGMFIVSLFSVGQRSSLKVAAIFKR